MYELKQSNLFDVQQCMYRQVHHRYDSVVCTCTGGCTHTRAILVNSGWFHVNKSTVTVAYSNSSIQ